MNKTTFVCAGKILCAFTVILFAYSSSYAQEEYAIQFQEEAIQLEENITSFQWSQIEAEAKVQDGYYTWIQFYDTPVQAVQDRMRANGIEIVNYIGNRTYSVFVPNTISESFIANQGVRSVVPVEGRFKLSEDLRYGIVGDWASEGDNILVTLQFHDKVSVDYVISDLATKQITVKQQYKGFTNIDLSIPNNCLDALVALPYVKFVEVIAAPAVKEDTPARALHRAAGLDTQTSAGRNYTGEGIGVLVRDDGIVGPHIDFHGRIDNSSASGSGPTHGDGVAGILAGAGNLNPNYRGMAAGSNVFVVNYGANFQDAGTVGYINDGSVQITNSSYGDGCNGGYTTGTQTVDQQIKDTPSLLHVFSCGNSNNNDCGYGAGNQWGNITGGHKQGKNVIATANVFFDGSLVGSSSHGPATDGRIKPDIAANGQNQISTDENNGYLSFGGTSGASPGIAGISAQLYEAYGEFNGGALPQSALIKAALLNTANDAGNVGPDFKFGWGIVNGLRAGLLIEDGRFLMDSASQGVTNTHTINVPAGTTQVRFMAYWADEAAAAGATTALVNDLDLVVTDPESTQLLPWILDPTPDPALLDLPATNGVDHLNNMEQVLINNPVAGDYTIDVSGFNVPVGPQEYFVVYEIIKDALTVTYPNDGESFVPGTSEVIHWDATNTTSDFVVEYSNDGGGTYNTIATVPSGTDFFIWTVPSDVTGIAKVRVTSGVFSDESDGTFSMANQVTGLNITSACPTEATFTWDALGGAESYDLYLLGDQYMEIVGTSTTNSVTVPIPSLEAEMWYAITASSATAGWSSERTIATFYPGGLLNCVLNNDLTVTTINSSSANFSDACGDADGLVTATLENNGVSDQTNFTVSYELSGQAPVDETYTGTLLTGETVEYTFTTPLTIATSGEYTLTISVNTPGDEYVENDSQSIDFYVQTDVTAAPFTEDFESAGFPADGWSILNPDGSDTWIEATGVTGVDGGGTTTGFIDNFAYNGGGSEDIMQTVVFDLNVNEPVLKFDLAKAQYSDGFSDALRVEISTDCGVTYSQIYYKDELDLSTVANYVTSSWFPASGGDWRTEEVDLAAYQGETAIFRVINISGFGNGTFVDNFNVDETLSVDDNILSGISVYPNPANNQVTVVLPVTMVGEVIMNVTNSLGQTITTVTRNNESQNTVLDVSSYATGMYFVTISNGGATAVKKLIVQ